MSDSVEYRNGVFVATGPQEPVDGATPATGTTGTALMARPDEHLAPLDEPGALAPTVPLATAAVPPVGPSGPVPTPTRSGGGATRATIVAAVAALIAAVAFGAAAFGGAFDSGTPGPGSARGALGAAGAASASATSVAFTVSATQASSANLKTLITGSGAVDLASDVGHLSATVPALAGIVGSGNDSVNVITSGSSVYLSSPALSSVTGGARWLKATLPTGATTGNNGTDSLSVLTNPSQLLGLLASIGGQVTTMGHVDLGGTSTTEYKTTVTVADLAARSGLTTGSALGKKAADVLGALGNTTIPVTAWVGTDGYVRQISASVDLSRATLGGLAGALADGSFSTSAAGKATTSTTVTVGFSHYGDPVSVTVPPASQTTDLNAISAKVSHIADEIGHAVSSFASRF
jgi:hypothetical protein